MSNSPKKTIIHKVCEQNDHTNTSNIITNEIYFDKKGNITSAKFGIPRLKSESLRKLNHGIITHETFNEEDYAINVIEELFEKNTNNHRINWYLVNSILYSKTHYTMLWEYINDIIEYDKKFIEKNYYEFFTLGCIDLLIYEVTQRYIIDWEWSEQLPLKNGVYEAYFNHHGAYRDSVVNDYLFVTENKETKNIEYENRSTYYTFMYYKKIHYTRNIEFFEKERQEELLKYIEY